MYGEACFSKKNVYKRAKQGFWHYDPESKR